MLTINANCHRSADADQINLMHHNNRFFGPNYLIYNIQFSFLSAMFSVDDVGYACAKYIYTGDCRAPVYMSIWNPQGGVRCWEKGCKFWWHFIVRPAIGVVSPGILWRQNTIYNMIWTQIRFSNIVLSMLMITVTFSFLWATCLCDQT